MGRYQGVVIIIPAFNEAMSIGKVVKELESQFSVIVVNDCSSDKTAEIAENSGAIVVRHSSNRGYEESLRTGFKKAYESGFKYFLTCDADGQHTLSDILKVADQIVTGKYDLVVGERARSARLAEAVFSVYTKLMFSVNDPLSGLKAYSRKGYELLGCFSNYNSIGTELALKILKSGLPYLTLNIHIHPRSHGSPRFGSILRTNIMIFKALSFQFTRVKDE